MCKLLMFKVNCSSLTWKLVTFYLESVRNCIVDIFASDMVCRCSLVS